MWSSAVVINREVKNKVTGLDLYVSDYQEIPHRIKSSFQYHVIVITNLFYYKRSDLKDSDVVQFMVSKTFEEFEVLYHQLYKRFPSVIFPELPKKSLFSNDTAARFECMNKVLRMVAATQKLCCSPMVIAFLKETDTKENPSSLQSISPKVSPVVSNNDSNKEEDISTVFNQDLMEEVDLFSAQNEPINDKEENISTLHSTQVSNVILEKENVRDDSSRSKEFQDHEDFIIANKDEDDLLKMLGNASIKQPNILNLSSQVNSSVLRTRVSSNVEESDLDFFKKTKTLPMRSSNQKSLKERRDRDELFGIPKKMNSFFDDVSVDEISLFSASLNEPSKKDIADNKSADEFITEKSKVFVNNEDFNKTYEAQDFITYENLERRSSQKGDNFDSDDDIVAYDNEINRQFTDVKKHNISGSLQEEIEQTDLLNSQEEIEQTDLLNLQEDPNYGSLFISDSEIQNTNIEHESLPCDNIDDIMQYIAKHNLDEEEVSLGF
ncbi:uncharacterized protein LOC101235144 isoform X2 [Hydra vulgaris]|uniref:Uncharacterized protein LOC101235144 isoform X2 n=1 Tax=Hydra vulgaris TaxID=6087 RepID=A0ABM4BSL1_HYDVU